MRIGAGDGTLEISIGAFPKAHVSMHLEERGQYSEADGHHTWFRLLLTITHGDKTQQIEIDNSGVKHGNPLLT